MKRVKLYTKNGNSIEVRDSMVKCFVGKGFSRKNPKQKEVEKDGR